MFQPFLDQTDTDKRNLCFKGNSMTCNQSPSQSSISIHLCRGGGSGVGGVGRGGDVVWSLRSFTSLWMSSQTISVCTKTPKQQKHCTPELRLWGTTTETRVKRQQYKSAALRSINIKEQKPKTSQTLNLHSAARSNANVWAGTDKIHQNSLCANKNSLPVVSENTWPEFSPPGKKYDIYFRPEPQRWQQE